MLRRDDGKIKPPYYGAWAIIPSMIIVPIILYIDVAALMLGSAGNDAELNEATINAIGFGLGSVFHIILFVSGVFKHSLSIVLQRVKDFFANLKVSFSCAVKDYLWDMKYNGVAFLIYFVIMLVWALLFLDGLKDALRILELRY